MRRLLPAQLGHDPYWRPGAGATPLVFRIIFLAIPSATMRSETGMNGLLFHPGRDREGPLLPGPHRVTGWAAISRSSRAASSSRVSPISTLLLALCVRLGRAPFRSSSNHLQSLKVGRKAPPQSVEIITRYCWGMGARLRVAGHRNRRHQRCTNARRETSASRLPRGAAFELTSRGTFRPRTRLIW